MDTLGEFLKTFWGVHIVCWTITTLFTFAVMVLARYRKGNTSRRYSWLEISFCCIYLGFCWPLTWFDLWEKRREKGRY